MDFLKIRERSRKQGSLEIYPDFLVKRSNDLMIRAKSFHAIWDSEKGLWSTDEYDVQRLVDEQLAKARIEKESNIDGTVYVKYMSDFSTNAWTRYRTYLNNMADNAKQLDMQLTFANTKVYKRDYVSRRLSYSLEEGDIEAYDTLMSTLYKPAERKKLEWAIGAIVAGDAKNIQKFIVLYGEGGSGKSTFLNVLQKLFDGYYTTFEAKALTGTSNTFATEVFRKNPLVAIQHDGDLSRIADNTKLNSLVSHEEMTFNEKYKPSYTHKANAFLFMATNKPVKITDAKSGIIRRLIDVSPSGKTIPTKEYHNLVSRIDFELGAIAHHCLTVYQNMGPNYYSTYSPLNMILQTDVFFNFVETHYYLFLQQGGVSLTQAWKMYKEFCEESLIEYRLPRYKFRDELKNYFEEFLPVTRIDNKQVRSYYKTLIRSKFKEREVPMEEAPPGWLFIDETESSFDKIAEKYSAQYASRKYETPVHKWSKVSKTLSEINTNRLHYVKLPINHIVIDFDIRDDKGKKSSKLNLEAATKFPPTYAEFSKSQCGVHLHYIYTGDPEKLDRIYDEGIEVKVFKGDSALRRKLSKCNNIPVAELHGGLPLKKEQMINFKAVQSEKGLRDLIARNLRKEIHPGTKPSIDFIFKILEEAYESDLPYDVNDLKSTIIAFAASSTNQAPYCLRLVQEMKFNSEESGLDSEEYVDDRIVFYDVEVFPNLFIVNWKFAGEDKACIHMINPTAQEIEELLKFKLIGFNNRRYDNHILYARFIGYDNKMLFDLSFDIINGKKRALFGEAYSISYTDVYDFTSKKQSLKKWQIELGINHQELPFPFDEPVEEKYWPMVIEYCDNDVISTEVVFNHRKEDFVARQILAELSGLTVNDTTQNHTAKIIFGNNYKPQSSFEYTDLSELFPGYTFDAGKSEYRGENPKEGGYVYSQPGYYEKVALLDIASMHPTSIVLLNLFGPYTDNFNELIKTRLDIKSGNLDSARELFGGKLQSYLQDGANTKSLAYALKIAINIVYGLTSARFSNKFKDNRNIDNIVAKRGSLFMIDLKHAVQDKGVTVAHIKTDSIKIPKATKSIINFITKFGKKYGYTFEHEVTYDKFCLVNDAVYIARKEDGTWTATGAEFAHPYIFKTLFSKESIEFKDLCETKAVTTAMYLDMNEGMEEDLHNYIFVGKASSFVPIKPGAGGGILYRKKNDKYYAVGGTKGYRWLESELVKELGKEDDIDLTYYDTLVSKAVAHINKFVDYNDFVS